MTPSLNAAVTPDEFAVLCEDTEPHHAAAIVERLHAAAAAPFLVDDIEIVLSASVGSYPAHVADPGELLRRADRRMYESKRRTTPFETGKVEALGVVSEDR